MAIHDKNIRLMHIASFLKSKPKGANFKEILKHLEELYHKESFATNLASSQRTFNRDLPLLLEMGIDKQKALSTIRLSFLPDTTEQDIDMAIDEIKQCVDMLSAKVVASNEK